LLNLNDHTWKKWNLAMGEFSSHLDLIMHVICADNDNLNVVDQEGSPVVATRYRQNEFWHHNMDFHKP
jgi:hypothetical protein